MPHAPMERNIYEQSIGEGVPQTSVPMSIPSRGENAQHTEQQGDTTSLPCAGETPPAGEESATTEEDSEPRSASPYSPDNLILYHTSLGLFERLEKRGVITRDDYRQAVRILTERYGFPPNSIFAEGA